MGAQGKQVSLVKRQFDFIRMGGWLALKGKLTLLLLAPVLVPTVILVRLMRPLILVRFGQLSTSRIGHFALDTEMYLCERDTGIDHHRTWDFFFHATPVSNHQLKKLWNRVLWVSRIFRYLDTFNRTIPGGEYHLIQPGRKGIKDAHGVMARTDPHLRFTAAEEQKGRQALTDLGVPEGASFVCFTARDPAYLKSWISNREWGYHDYRNCSIQDYMPAVEEMRDRGYFALRMGAVVQERLRATDDMIIDYASGFRTDFLDIYLAAKCRFFITSGTGIDSVATVFRRPVAYANYIPIGYFPSWGPDDLFIPKKLWLEQEQRFLTIRELLSSGIGWSLSTEQYENLGIKAVDNTPEEITDLVVEMDERLKNTWRSSPEDEELQRGFWSLFDPGEIDGVTLPHVGADFLRQNRQLLV